MKILIIKTSSLGDILHAFDVVSYLKTKFKECTIDWVVEERCSELVMAHPDISHVWIINTKKWRTLFRFMRASRKVPYDLVLDLQGNMKSGLFTLAANSLVKVGFGMKTVPEFLNVFTTTHRFDPPPGQNIRDDLLFLVKRYFGDELPFLAKPVGLQAGEVLKILPGGILVCPGSQWKNKRLSLEDLIMVLRQYEGPFYYVWGSEEERAFCGRLVEAVGGTLLEKLTFAELQGVMRQGELVIAMDSLPLHLAALAGVKTLSFFGPSSGQKYAPRGEGHEFLQGACPYGVVFEKRCPKLRTCKSGACMKQVVLPLE